MITVNDIERALFDWAPPELAMKNDRVGLQAGERHKSVRSVLVALDVTQAVIAEAVFTARADLIVSHHGIMYENLALPTDDTDMGSLLLTLCQTGIASVVMHTNLDAAKGGINDVLAELFGLEGATMFEADELGRIGKVPQPVPVKDFAARCKAAVATCAVRFHDSGKPVHNVALCSGGGGSWLEKAIKAGCDTYLTGDASHHNFLTAKNQGVNLVECGHFATENVIVRPIAEYLSKRFPALQVTVSKAAEEPYQCL